MAYEYPSAAGTVQLVRIQRPWQKAISRHQSGLPAWDRRRVEAPEDLLDWRPLGDSL
jgi:hypothetical protein